MDEIEFMYGNKSTEANKFPHDLNSRMELLMSVGVVAACLPYAILYLFNLWGHSHYQFYPLLIGAVVWIFHKRVATYFTSGVIHRHFIPLVCLTLLVALVGTAFASPWIGFLAFVCSSASFLLNRRDRETGSSMINLSLPLLLIWQPPYSTSVNGDALLIGILQQISSFLASRTLDCFGFVHLSEGTILEFPNRKYGVAEACSGVQSFFAILCFAALLIVYFRRPVVHALLLFASCSAWAVLMNTMRIAFIPISQRLLDLDLSSGMLHECLGFGTMGFAIILLSSTDYLLVLALPVIGSKPREWINTTSIERSKLSMYQLGPVLGAILLIASLQVTDIYSSWGKQRHLVNFFNEDVMIEFEDQDCPDKLGNWRKIRYFREIRERGADLGGRSDCWQFQTPSGLTPPGLVNVSVDQAFPGWHELTVCYINAGWKLEYRKVLNDDESDWPIVSAEFSDLDGQRAILFYSMFDRSGNVVEPPGKWDMKFALWHRIKNRLSPSIRNRLFGLAAYQVQLFVIKHNSATTKLDEEYLAAYLAIRNLVKANALD